MANKTTKQPNTALEAQRAIEANVPAFLEAAPDAMVIVSQDGRMLLINGQAERLFGYERSELLGQPVEMLVPARYRGRHPEYRSGFFAEPRPRPMGAGVDLYGVREDGTEFPAEISLGPVETPQGVLVTAAIRDVTRTKEGRSKISRLPGSSARRRRHRQPRRRHSAGQLADRETVRVPAVGARRQARRDART